MTRLLMALEIVRRRTLLYIDVTKFSQRSNAELALMVDASEFAVGAVMQQKTKLGWQPY